MASFNSAVIARAAAALYDTQLGNASMTWALNAVDSVTYGGSVAALVQDVYNRDFKSMTYAQVAAVIVKNVGITTGAADAAAYIAGQLTAAGAGKEGTTLVGLLNAFAALTNHPVAAYNTAATAFNAQITAAVNYAAYKDTPDAIVHPAVTIGANQIFTLVAEKALGADVMHITGGMDARIDFTNPANQVRGLDLDGDGTIETNGIENVSSNFAASQRGANFEIVDAYSRNPLNHLDSANNYLGDLAFDGTGFKGDGVNTNGNVFLGGLGHDVAFGGDGNDFLAGGGIAQGHGGRDVLRGGRNADFFFAEFSGIDATDGGGDLGLNTLMVDGGNTADNSSAGQTGAAANNNSTSQDQDWLLFEASDDDEPVQITLNENQGAVGTPVTAEVQSRSGESMTLRDVENFDASGNLYGFLDDMSVQIGGRATDDRDAAKTADGHNYGYGASAQLRVTGSEVANIIIAGYDNDWVSGGDGNDILFGGNLAWNNNPNLAGIVNDGRDELYGGGGNDSIVFEADGGVIDGGTSDTDTLYLTNLSLGTKTATDMTSDNRLRFDLDAQNLAAAAGFGGADVDGTQDQTNYKSGITGGRVTVKDMDSIIATGMGAIDYKAAGTNNPELLFTNQQNQKGYSGNLDLRGNSGANVLYATDGADVIEGRGGNDSLSGGDGNDDFYFGTHNGGGGEASNIGDNVDVIHRQKDANGDNLWDTSSSGANLYERDFNIGGSSSTGASSLVVDLGTTNLASADVAMTSFTVKIGGVTFAVTDNAALMAANNANEVAALVNTAYKAIDAKVTAVAVNNTIVVTDTGGRVISSTVSEGYAVGGVVSNGAFSALATFNPAGTTTTKDRLIYKSYEDRADNEGTDDDSFHGSAISLGTDAYAEDLVINFADEDGNGLATTRLAEDQSYKIVFTNLTTQDKVTIEVNGVKYSLQVGVDLDGNIINNEDTNSGTSQADIQKNFLARLGATVTGFIDTFMDDDTSVGAINSAVSTTNITGDTLTITQRVYNGEQTVFMVKPTVTLQNLSGGEPASASVTNVSQHEVELLDFDGRNGELNATNVLFVGQEFVSRATLATAKTAGQTINGNEAIVIDVGADNLQDTVFNSTTVTTANNTASNSNLWGVTNGFAVHGDDFLLGGAGLDVINGGTGDDRVEGSIGGNGSTTWDVLDGGKNIYAVQVLGETQARLYVLNKWEAANPSKVTALQNLTISSIQLINQSEDGLTAAAGTGVFDDTLQFSQRNFTAGATRFTVVLNDFALNGTTVELRNDGAGTVGVDVDGDGTIDNWTKFTNFENIRTVSGTSNAIAGDGQGNDTLDVQLLSSTTTGAGGISYNLTNDGGAGEVRYSTDAILTTPVGGDFPVAADYESLVLKVDGVENVLASTGADLVIVDETEAAKNNTFTLGLGVDRVDYRNQYATNDSVAEPTITIKVDNVAASVGGVDTVTSTAGRVGSTQAVDSLGGVEYIQLSNGTATSVRENDVLDVTSMTAGSVVSYIDGTVKDLSGTTHVTVQNLVEIENVWADGNDKVIVADSVTMRTNDREDAANSTAAQNILFMTYADFDDLNSGATTRKSFAAQVADATITTVINQGEFTFNLSKTGTGADVDRVDYSAEDGRIVVPVGQGTATKPQYVVVDGDIDGAWNDLDSRIDVLRSVEEIVAAKGQSVMDYTDVGQARQITFQYTAPSSNPAENQVIEQTIRIADGSGNTISGLNTFVEKWTYNNTTAAVADATWNRIEGSDAAEVVIYNGSEDLVNQSGLDHRFTQDVLTLRGGNNEVRYSPLETSISANITVTEENTATAGTAEGSISATITFQDGKGVGAPSTTFLGGQHSITSHTSDNSTAAGSLKIEGSQDAEDVVTFTSASQKVFLLGVSAGVLNVNIGALQTMVLTGFEFIGDASSNDVYDFKNLSNATGLKLVDNGVADHDMIKVYSDALGAGNTIDLNTLNTQWGTFDFDVLDVSGVSSNAMTTVVGVNAGTTEEVVIGALNNAGNALTATDFDSVVFTQGAVTQMGTTFTFNPTTGAIVAGAKTITAADADAISFGGLVFENSLRDGRVASVSSGITFNISGTSGTAITVVGGSGNDSLTTAGGNDTLIGGGGNDTLDGGFVAEKVEVHTFTLSNPSGGADADAVTINGFTVTEGATVQSVVVANDDADAIGAAFVRQWGASPASFAANANIQSITYDALTNALTVTFKSAAGNVADNVLTATSSATEAGTLGAETVSQGYVARQESNDVYTFEATAAKNGADTINNFNQTGAAAADGDRLDFSLFLATRTADTAGAVNFGIGNMTLGGAENVGVAFNVSGGTLSSSMIKTAATAANGQIVMADNAKAVIIVTADADGAADATVNAYNVYYVEDTDAGSGQSWSVSLVGTVNSATELTAATWFDTDVGGPDLPGWI